MGTNWFFNSSYDVPSEDIYWKNHIPSDFDYFNLSGISTEYVPTDDEVEEGVGVGVTLGSKTKRIPYTKIIVDLQIHNNGMMGTYIQCYQL